jgi:3D (Asp-Asp-Asp) domain-containing protein
MINFPKTGKFFITFMTYLQTIKTRKTEIAVLAILVYQLLFPHQALAAESKKSLIEPDFTISAQEDSQAVNEEDSLIEPKDEGKITLITPVKEAKVIRTYKNLVITAYSSTVDQTDSSPCITANGFNLCQHNQEDVIAANFLPFGTKVRIPEYFGDRIFTVQDRMHSRYNYRADVWFRDRHDAVHFGAVVTTIEIIE